MNYAGQFVHFDPRIAFLSLDLAILNTKLNASNYIERVGLFRPPSDPDDPAPWTEDYNSLFFKLNGDAVPFEFNVVGKHSGILTSATIHNGWPEVGGSDPNGDYGVRVYALPFSDEADSFDFQSVFLPEFVVKPGRTALSHAGDGDDVVRMWNSGTFYDTWMSASQFFGEGGNDRITGGNLSDTIEGGAGDDVLFGMAGDDHLFGREGNDELHSGTGELDFLHGGPGNDTLEGSDRGDHITGDEDDDLIYGHDGTDYVEGGDGDDHVVGGAGDDRILGGTGLDLIEGGSGGDHIEGNEGHDRLYGDAGADRFVWRMGDGGDEVDGGEDDDILQIEGDDFGNEFSVHTLDSGQTVVDFGADELVFRSIEWLELHGKGGDDRFEVRNLSEQIALFDIRGDDGSDALSFASADNPVDVDLSAGSWGFSSSERRWWVDGIERVVGSRLADRLTGSDRNETIEGGDGDDVIEAGPGDDFIFGGMGDDDIYWRHGDGVDEIDGGAAGADGMRIFGWDGADRYVFRHMGTDLVFERSEGEAKVEMIMSGIEALIVDGQSGDDHLEVKTNTVSALFGGDGFDVLISGGGADILNGGSNPEVRDEAGVIIGGQGDILLGGYGNDRYYVDSTLDLVDEGYVFKWLAGGAGGDDTIFSSANWYWDVYGIAETIAIQPEASDPTGAGTTIVAGLFDNDIYGNAGTNVLFGRGGSDTYYAGDGVDFISLSTLGATDENAYLGVDGSNTIVVERRTSGPVSYDIVFDFESGNDKVDVSDYGFAGRAAAFATGVNDGAGNCYFILGDGLDYLYIVGLTLDQMSTGDFIV